MKNAFEIACDNYQLRKLAEHQVRLRLLQREMTRWPDASPERPKNAPASAQPSRR